VFDQTVPADSAPTWPSRYHETGRPWPTELPVCAVAATKDVTAVALGRA